MPITENDIVVGDFLWGEQRNLHNMQKHGIRFEEARYAFRDKNRLIVYDEKHSTMEERWFCIGLVEEKVLTVRFVFREHKIRIFGAASWREWRDYYYAQNTSL